jgi:hypothetical protein
MKTKTNLPKIVSTSIALILCSAVLLFALTLLSWGGGLPAHAHPATGSALSNPQQGPLGQQIAVSGSGLTGNDGTTVDLGYSTDSTCATGFTSSGSTATLSSGGFNNATFNWPTTGTTYTAVGTIYQVCIHVSTNTPQFIPASPFKVIAAAAQTTATSSPPSGVTGATITVSASNIPAPASATPETVVFGYGPNANSCSGFVSVGSGSNPTISGGSFSNATFTWPNSGTNVGTTYTVCVQISGASGGTLMVAANNFLVTGAGSSASVKVDQSSYTVGDSITVSGTGFPASASVSIELQSADGVTTTSLGSVQSDTSGAFTQSYTVPQHPRNAVVAIATSGSVSAKSSQFTVNASASSNSAPPPAAAPPPPVAPAVPPPVVIVATPTPAATDTPTPVPTDTPTPEPVPTVLPTPVSTPVVTHNSSLFGLSGKLPAILGIGLGTLLGLGILFAVGWLLLRKYLAPAPQPSGPPNGVPPWMREQDPSQQNTMMNGAQFGQTMPFNGPLPPENGGFGPSNGGFGPGDGGFAPVGAEFGPPQQMPFNGPGNGGFGPGPNNGIQQVPFDDPFQPANNGGFAPAGVGQGPYPPQDWPTQLP